MTSIFNLKSNKTYANALAKESAKSAAKQQGGKAGNQDNGQCYTCGEYGHTSRNCPSQRSLSNNLKTNPNIIPNINHNINLKASTLYKTDHTPRAHMLRAASRAAIATFHTAINTIAAHDAARSMCALRV